MIDYHIAHTASDYQAAKQLFSEYADSIHINLDFQHFDEELAALKSMYSAPVGGIILAKQEDELVGCVAIRKIDRTTGELKRMYIKPEHQNKGVGKSLLQHALELAGNCGYKLVQLDTLDHMHAAIHLYMQAGFYQIPAYYHNPIKSALYFEKKL